MITHTYDCQTLPSGMYFAMLKGQGASSVTVPFVVLP